ncbi:MAG: DUF3473 domain-containing protein [Candidatus Hatepunaea meridiana]|nr:DUF3473 domain-containing protein [Candidatus Hatepunaea meridiana]
MKNGFSVDVEDWFHVLNLSCVIPRSTWDSRQLRIERNIDRILELLDSHNARGTFFILGWIAHKLPGLIRNIHKAGHEIASHGDDHRIIYHQLPSEFKSLLMDHKAYLEDLIGTEVIGYRAPNFSITRQSWWALDVLNELGYKYDSSVFPFKRKHYGIAGASVSPYWISLGESNGIVEIPLSVIVSLGKVIPVAGGGYFRLLPYPVTRWAIRRIEKEDRPYCFYIHPWEIDPKQPRPKGLPLRNRFMHYLNLKECEKRLNKLLSDFTFTTYSDIASMV